MFDFAKLKRTIASLGNERKKLNFEIEALKQKREELNALPRSKEDLAELVDAWLVQQRGTFLKVLNRNVGYLITNPKDTLEPGKDLRIFQFADALGTRSLRDGALLGLLGPLIRDQLKQAIMELPDYPKETGPAYPQRVAEIEKLDKQISELELKTATLKEQASEAGIQLEPEQEFTEPEFIGGTPVTAEGRKKAYDKVNKR